MGASGRLYTGADVTGTITMSTEGHTPLSASISNRIEPPDSCIFVEGTELPHNPTDAPLWRTVEDGVCGAFSEWFGGTEVTDLLKEVRGSWPPRGDECGGWGQSRF